MLGNESTWLGDRVEEHMQVFPDMTPLELTEAVVDQVCQLEADQGRPMSTTTRADLRSSVAREVRRREQPGIDLRFGSDPDKPWVAA